jgi:hypothetical protein
MHYNGPHHLLLTLNHLKSIQIIIEVKSSHNNPFIMEFKDDLESLFVYLF